MATGLSSLQQSKSKANAESHESEQRIPLKVCSQTALGVTTVGVVPTGMTDEVQLDGIEGWDEVCDNYAIPNGVNG